LLWKHLFALETLVCFNLSISAQTSKFYCPLHQMLPSDNKKLSVTFDTIHLLLCVMHQSITVNPTWLLSRGNVTLTVDIRPHLNTSICPLL
jgi:hypothetical protein